MSVLTLPVYRLSVEQYHEMSRKGILKSGDPVELIEGLLVQKMPKKPPHSFATQTLRELLARLLPPEWFVNTYEPVTTSDSEPEPDVTVLRGARRQYLVQNRQPGPADTGLVIEVAESSLPTDRGIKARVYARAAVPVYWIVNLIDRRVEVYTNPSGPCDDPAYRQQHDYGPNEEVPVTLDGQDVGRIRVSHLLL